MNSKALAVAVAVILPAVFLSACQNDNVQQPGAASFASQPAYTLDVATLEFSELYKSPMQKPNVEHTFDVKLSQMVKGWASDRFKPKGADKSLRVELINASVIETALPLKKGVKGFFTKQQSAKYDAKLEVALKIYDGTTLLPETELSVLVTRSRSVPENFSAAERKKFFQDLENTVISDLNIEVDKQIKSYFGKYLIN